MILTRDYENPLDMRIFGYLLPNNLRLIELDQSDTFASTASTQRICCLILLTLEAQLDFVEFFGEVTVMTASKLSGQLHGARSTTRSKKV